jgi:hypothetical protein
MVYLEPPFHLIEGVTVFTDHADPLQFYFLPMMPHLTTVEDKVLHKDIPQIQLIKYRGKAGGGGFLNFDVNLGIEQGHLNDIKQKIKQLHKLKQEPRLVPVPLIDGTVKLMILGKDSTAAPSTTPPSDKPQFVIKMTHSAKPSLFGDNQASFSVELDEAGVIIVEKCFEGELLPIGIVYSLDYLALRPAYSVKLKVDWDRVQTHLHESFGTNFMVVSSQVDKIVDELIEKRVIDLQIDSFIPMGGEDVADVKTRFDQAVSEVKEMVLENFFEPSINPVPVPPPSDLDKVIGAFARVSAIVATHGASELGFSYKKTEMTRIDKKRLDVNMSERTTVKRSIYPQAHLQGLFQIIRDERIGIDRFVLKVDLNDPWFQERRVRVISRANFAQDNIESVNVKLKYGNDSKNTILDINKPQELLSWSSIVKNKQMIREVKASYEVAFKSANIVERPIKLVSKEQIIEEENFEVRPHELYSLMPVSILALDFPWEVFPFIDVAVTYQDANNKLRIEANFQLNSTRTSDVWKLFRLDPNKDVFRYKLTYRAKNHKDIEMPWVETDAEQIIIRDPYPSKRRLLVVPSFNWDEINMVFVDASYEDKANKIKETFAIEFSPDDKIAKTVTVQQLTNPEYRFMNYKVTTLFNDGRVRELPPSTTISERIILSSSMKGHRIITVKADPEIFAKNKIKEVAVFMKYEDTKGDISFVDSFIFSSAADRPQYFEFDYVDALKETFDYQLIFSYKSGMQTVSEWKKSKDNNLLFKNN